MAKKNVQPELYTLNQLKIAISDIHLQASSYIKLSLKKHNFDKDAVLADWLSFYEVSKIEVIKAFNYPFNLMAVLLKLGQIKEPNLTPAMNAGLYVSNLIWGRCAVSSLLADPDSHIDYIPSNVDVSLKSENPEQLDDIQVYVPYSKAIHKIMLHSAMYDAFNYQMQIFEPLMQEK